MNNYRWNHHMRYDYRRYHNWWNDINLSYWWNYHMRHDHRWNYRMNSYSTNLYNEYK